MPLDPDPRRSSFGVPKVFLRWWPLWLLLVMLLIALMSIVPALLGGGPARGPGATHTAPQFAPDF